MKTKLIKASKFEFGVTRLMNKMAEARSPDYYCPIHALGELFAFIFNEKPSRKMSEEFCHGRNCKDCPLDSWGKST